MAILPHHLRISALHRAAEFFDHRDKVRHDYEVREGAASILYQKLAFALQQQQQQYQYQQQQYQQYQQYQIQDQNNYLDHGTDAIVSQRLRSDNPNSSDVDSELSIVASCLEMVHRSSANAITQIWHEIGMEALPILVKVLERPFLKLRYAAQSISTSQQSPSPASTPSHSPTILSQQTLSHTISRDMKLAVQKISKILAVYSLIPEAKEIIANCPRLLPLLVQIIDTHNMNRMSITLRPTNNQQSQTQSQYNRPQTNNHTITLHNTSSNGIKGVSSGVGLHMTEASRFNTIAILTNLAAAEPNRMFMLAEPGLVDNISRVVHNERSDIARQCSALAIMNLSNGDRDHVPELAGNDLLLETLILLMQDEEPETKRNAAVALFNVACADQNTVKLVRYKDGLILDALINLVTDDTDTRGVHDEARTNAAEALFNISCSAMEETTDRMVNHTHLLESIALTLKSQTANLDVKMYAAATLRRMAEIINSPKPTQSTLLTALVKASDWTRTPCIAEAFLSQTNFSSSNCTLMVQHHGLLNALSKLALTVGGEESDRVRNAAIAAIERLSRQTNLRKSLAHNKNIMMALTRASYRINTTTLDNNNNMLHPNQNPYHQEEKIDSIPNLINKDYLPEQQNHEASSSFAMNIPSTSSHTTNQSNQGEEIRRIQIALKHLVNAM